MKRPALWVTIAALFVLGIVSALPVSAFATLTSYVPTCNSFSASGTTNAPYIVVQVDNGDISAEGILVYRSYPANPDGTFNISVLFELQPAGTVVNYYVWGSPINNPDGWDGESFEYKQQPCQGQVQVPGPGPGPGIPNGFVLNSISCTVAVYDSPAGNPIAGATILTGQTWFTNPASVQGSDGQAWTEVFVGGYTNGYIPTSCVGSTS